MLDIPVLKFLKLFESPKVIEFEFPEAWACALMYGDFDGVSFEDRVRILHFQRTHGLHCAQSMSDEPSRMGYHIYSWLVPQDWVDPTEKPRTAPTAS